MYRMHASQSLADPFATVNELNLCLVADAGDLVLRQQSVLTGQNVGVDTLARGWPAFGARPVPVH